MKNPFYIVFVGVLVILMGIGSNNSVLFPKWLFLVIGGYILMHGLVLIYNAKKNAQNESKQIFRSSYFYMLLGAFMGKVIMDNERITSLLGLNSEIGNTFILIISLGCMAYGVYLYFQEKKNKIANKG